MFQELTAGSVRNRLLECSINEFWSHIGVRPSSTPGDPPLVVIEVKHHDITFQDLVEISVALSTTRINLDNEVREGGYCETCRYSYSVTVLTVMGASMPAKTYYEE